MGLKTFVILGLLPQVLSASVTYSFSVVASDGATYKSLASTRGLSVADFKSLNPGVDCLSLVRGHSYCVLGLVSSSPTSTSTTSSASTSTTTTLKTTTSSPSTTSPSGQSPTQPGLAENCDKFYKVKSGD